MNSSSTSKHIVGLTLPVFLALTLLILLGFVGLQSSSGQANLGPASTLPDISGLAWMEGDWFIAVHDAKNPEENDLPRVSVLRLPDGLDGILWQAQDVKFPIGKKSNDFESIARIPGTSNALLVESTHEQEEKPLARRMFLSTFNGDTVQLNDQLMWPVETENVEGTAIAKVGEQMLFIYAERAEGQDETEIHFADFTMDPLDLGDFHSAGIFVTPGPTGEGARPVSAIDVDSDGVVYVASAEDPGDDNGPFNSAVYAIGQAEEGDDGASVVLYETPQQVGMLDGLKVESLAVRENEGQDKQLFVGLDDENYGGTLRPLPPFNLADDQEEAGGEAPIGLPNPASEYCVDQGGVLDIRDEDDGQVGYCIFEDGSECEEWAYFNGDCEPAGQEEAGGEAPVGLPNPASEYCVDQGGSLDIRDEDGGQAGYCVFLDGSECEEWAYFNGECEPGNAYKPLSPDACDGLAEAMTDSFTVEVVTDQASFDDYVTGKTGIGCQATAEGSAVEFESLAESAAVFGAMLEAQGWEEDQQYSADGPTGTVKAYSQDNALCLMQISWEPSEDADCPADQPISACELTPEQQLYTATLNCAQLVADPESHAGMPDPASDYCVNQGGELEIRDEDEGQVGYCIFEDGSECEEWAFFDGECEPGGQEEAGDQEPIGMPNPASEYCVDQGGELEIRDEDEGQVGYCIFDDGSECEEWAFFDGECAPGEAQESAAPATAVEQYEEGYRFDKNGWIYLHIEGGPYDRGYQHGTLLAPELEEIFGNFKELTYEETGKEWAYFRDQAVAQFEERIDEEYLEEIKGIADGAQAAGTEITWQDVLTWNGYEELLGYWWPNQMAGRYAEPDKDHCSAFIATGSATKDGKIVMAHNTWDAFAHGQFMNVIMDLEPAEGQRMFMQSAPGFIASFTDFFVTGAGIMGTETTMGGYSEYDPDEDPEFFRIRKAMQYAENLDDFVQLLEKDNNGGYANSWLLADANTGEIMRFELGLEYQNVERTNDGYFVGFNAATDPRIRNLESSNTGYDDVRTPAGARRVRLTQLMEEHQGEIDVQLAEEILADHYDVYLGKENPGSRTVEGRYDLDPFEYWPARLPFAPQGAVDGKAMDSDMAADLSFWARWGSSSGLPFDADEHIKEHPQWDHLAPYLKDRPTQPWTMFSAGEEGS